MKSASVILLILLIAACGSPPPTREESARAASADFAEQSRKSGDFREGDQPALLGENPFNGFCLLLDEVLEPELARGGSEADPAAGVLAAFEFPRDGEKFFAPVGATALTDRSLLLRGGRGAYLALRAPLDIPRDELSEIELRLRLEGNNSFNVGLSAAFLPDWDGGRSGTVNIPAAPGEDFGVYRVEISPLLRQGDFQRNLPPGERIRQFFLAAGDWPRKDIEIAAIRFLARGARYSKEPYGTGYLTLGGVIRKGLWMPVPGKLSWEIALPALPAYFSSGVGLFSPSAAEVGYEVRLTSGAGETTLGGGVIGDSSDWADLGPFSLDQWTSQTVTLTLETRGGEANTVFWGDPAIRERPRKRFNVIVILEDALRADRLGVYGYPSAVTPTTDRLAAEGICFQTALSQATMTRPSCPSILTSLYPSATGVWSFQDSLEERFLTLAEVMRRRGFLTAAFVQNPAGGAAAGLQQGFGEFYGRQEAGFLTAQLLPDRVGEWLEKNDGRNFFLYLHLLKPHGPYNPPPPFDAAFRQYTGPGSPVVFHHALDPPFIRQPTEEGRRLGYDGEIAANDHYLGLFLDRLEERGLREDTLIVILADHGEFLGEDGRWGHRPPGLLPAIHVPLIFSYPRLWSKGMRIAAPVQMLDVMPTILELAGVATDQLLLQGKSLLPLIEDPDSPFWNSRPVFSEEVTNLRREKEKRGLGSIFWGGKHFLFSNALGEEGDWSRQTRVFSLAGGSAAPVEAAEEEIAAAYGLLLNLQEAGAAINRNIRRGAENVQRHNPETIKQLRALGYLQ